MHQMMILGDMKLSFDDGAGTFLCFDAVKGMPQVNIFCFQVCKCWDQTSGGASLILLGKGKQMNQIKSSSICNFIFSSVTFYVIMVTTFNVICYASYKFKKSPHYNSGNKVTSNNYHIFYIATFCFVFQIFSTTGIVKA